MSQSEYNRYMAKKHVAFISGLVVIGIFLIAGIIVSHNHDGNALPLDTFPKGVRIGVWSWTAPDTVSLKIKQQNAQALKRQGVTEVYIDISNYNDYDELTGTNRQVKTAAFTATLRDEVRVFRSVGITPHALAGNVHWSDPDYSYIPLKLLNYVARYNQATTPDEQLAGMQFDIEFYNDKHFRSDYVANTNRFLFLTQQIITEYTQQFANYSKFALGFAISAAMDGTDTAYIPNVTDGNKVRSPLQILLTQLHDLPQAYLAVMTYRNTAAEAIARTQDEMNAADTTNVKILIGEETTNVTPSSLTFYGHSKHELKQMTNKLQQAFRTSPALGGYAINDEAGFLQLKD